MRVLLSVLFVILLLCGCRGGCEKEQPVSTAQMGVIKRITVEQEADITRLVSSLREGDPQDNWTDCRIARTIRRLKKLPSEAVQTALRKALAAETAKPITAVTGEFGPKAYRFRVALAAVKLQIDPRHLLTFHPDILEGFYLDEPPQREVEEEIRELIYRYERETNISQLINIFNMKDHAAAYYATEPLVAKADAAVLALTEALEAESEFFRFYICLTLMRISEKALPMLLEHTAERESKWRWKILIALGLTFGDDAPSSLIDALQDRKPINRAVAARMLGIRAVRKVMPHLLRLLNDKNRNVRIEAIDALGEIGDAAAVPALVRLLGDRDDLTARSAAIALALIGRKGAEAVRNILGSDKGQLVEMALLVFTGIGLPGTEVQIAKHLNSDDEELALLSAIALERLGSREAVSHLKDTLTNKFGMVRGRAALALTKLRITDSVPEIIKLTADENAIAQGDAVTALGILGTEAAIAHLAKLMCDPVVGESALNRLIAHSDAAKPHFVRLLTGDYPVEAKMTAARGIAEAKLTECAGILIDMLSDRNPRLRWVAGRALTVLTGEEFGYKHNAPQEERKKAIKAWQQWRSTQETRK